MPWAKTSIEILHSPPQIFLFIYTSCAKSQIYRLSTTDCTLSSIFSLTALNLSLFSQSTFRTTNANGQKGHFQFQFLGFERIMGLRGQSVISPILPASETAKILHHVAGQTVSQWRSMPPIRSSSSDTHRWMTSAKGNHWAELSKSVQHNSGLWTLRTWLLCTLSFSFFFFFFFFFWA